MPTSPVDRMRILSVPAVVRIMAWEEEAVKVFPEEMRVVLAAITVRELVAEIVFVLIVMVPPKVPVAA